MQFSPEKKYSTATLHSRKRKIDSPLLLFLLPSNITPIDRSCYEIIDSLILQKNFLLNAEKTLKSS